MKNIKNIKLFLIVGLIVSCTQNVNNTLPNPNKTNSPNPKGSNSPNIIPSQSPKPTDFPTITPSITVSTPSPNPERVKEIKVLSEDNEVIYIKELDKNYIYGENFYVMLPNQKKDFKAELIYNDGNIINFNNEISSPNPNFDFIEKNIKRIKWDSSNPIVANVDENGLINTYSLGEAIITATFYENNRELKLTFKIKVLESFITYYKGRDKDCNEITLSRDIEKIGYQSQGSTGITNGLKERPTFNGKVYDPNGVPVEAATVTAKAIDCDVNWVGEAQQTIGGAYVFRNAPVGARLLITVTKDGWTTRTRSEVLKSNLEGDPMANVFDFSVNYSIQDEPEIVSLKVNGQQVLKSSKDDIFESSKNSAKNVKPTPLQMSKSEQIQGFGNIPELTNINSYKLEVEMIFSEPIKVSDIQNYFRITSQSGFDNRTKNFTIDANYSGVEFTVSADEKVITFKANKAILTNKEGQEARYLIDFSQAFRDKTDKAAIDRRYFRFSNTQINDFAVFSVKNDETAPKLLGITARDGGSANDTIELRYSEPMERINQTSYTAVLVDSTEPLNLNRQLWYKDANDFKASTNPVANSIDDNNATLVGFLSGSDTDTSKFKASYMIGRILASEMSSTTSNTVKTSILGNKNRLPNTNPVKGNTTTNNLLRNARITGSNVLLEFSPDAFDRDDRLVVSVGKGIEGNFVDRNRTPAVNDELSVSTSGTSVEYASIYDPAGRLIDDGDLETRNNIDVNNSQRVATVN